MLAFVLDFFFEFFLFFPLVGMGTLKHQFKEEPPTTLKSHPMLPKCFDVFKVHSQFSFVEGGQEAGSLVVSQLIGSPAHMIPEGEGPQRSIQTPEEGSVRLKVTQQVSSV